MLDTESNGSRLHRSQFVQVDISFAAFLKRGAAGSSPARYGFFEVRTMDTGGAGPVTALIAARQMIRLGWCQVSKTTEHNYIGW